MTDTSLDLASLMCSRLCHDLLSPVGALNNGLELLADEQDPEMRQRCLELLEQSAKSSADKLKFFRLAFGAAGGFGDSVAVNDARDVVDALVQGNGRIDIEWNLGSESMPKAAVKTLLNFALMAIDSLVRGGTLQIAAELREGKSEIAVRASGERIAFDPDLGRALDGSLPVADLSSRTAPAEMLRQMAERLGGKLQHAQGGGALVLGAELPDV